MCLFFLSTSSLVLHAHPQLPVRRLRHQRNAARRVFDGIGAQVQNHLSQPVAIQIHTRLFQLHEQQQRRSALMTERRQNKLNLLQQSLNFEPRRMQTQLSRLDLQNKQEK